MNATEKQTYEIMANALFDQYAKGHGLPKVPVKIGANSMTRCAGRIKWSSRPREGFAPIEKSLSYMGQLNGTRTVYCQIVLSPYFIDRGHSEDILIETLKHEMAHLGQLVTLGVAEHDDSFRRWCLKLGCNPATYHNLGSETPNGEHCYYCPECGDVSRFSRRVERADGGTCTECSVRLQRVVAKHYVGAASVLERHGILRRLNESVENGFRLRVAAHTGEDR